MTNEFRAMCAELADALAEWRLGGGPPEDTADADLIERARALLAQPETEEPTDDEIEEWADACSEAPLEEMDPEVHGWRRCFTAKEFSETIRAAIARWGRPAAQPVAEGPTDQELLHLYQVATPCYSVEEYKRELDFARAVLARWGRPAAEPVPEPTDEALANFTAWFCRNYPGPDTLIHRPEWHAPKVFRAASDALARWDRPAAARLRNCPTHGQQPPEAWGCPDCVRELREELAASLHPTPAVEGEVEELVADLNEIAGILCGMEKHRWAVKLTRAAALLQQQAAPVPLIELPQGWHMLCDIEPEPGAMCDWVIMAPWGCDHGRGQWPDYNGVPPREFFDVPVGWPVYYKGFASADGVMVSDPKLTAWRMLPLPTMAAEARL